MKLRKIKYTDLNSKQKEVFNFQKVAGKLSNYGYNCIKLADDWQGADFLAYHKDGSGTLKVQLKARLALSKKGSSHKCMHDSGMISPITRRPQDEE